MQFPDLEFFFYLVVRPFLYTYTTGEISSALGLGPSEVAGHMNNSARQGLVRYDVEQKCYALAQKEV